MKLTPPANSPGRGGFTLAEVLAAMAFLAIVVPVIIQGLSIASRAGEVAERVLSESLVSTNWNQSSLGGTVTEGAREFAWTLNNEAWSENPMRQLTVEVKYSVQGRDYTVKLSTLVDGTTSWGTTQ
jgi:hypothetical protein